VYKQNNDFRYDLNFGLIKEKELSDILVQENIEVKTDRLWKNTGNVAVEFKSRGKKSGLATTHASYWAFILDNQGNTEGIIIVPIGKLKAIATYHYLQGKITFGGDENSSEMVLIPVSDLTK